VKWARSRPTPSALSCPLFGPNETLDGRGQTPANDPKQRSEKVSEEDIGRSNLSCFKKRRLSNTAQIIDGSGAVCRRLKDSQGNMRLDASFVTVKLCARFLMNRPKERSGFGIQHESTFTLRLQLSISRSKELYVQNRLLSWTICFEDASLGVVTRVSQLSIRAGAHPLPQDIDEGDVGKEILPSLKFLFDKT